MSTQEMKQLVIKRIEKEEDDTMLMNIMRLLDHDVEIQEPEVIYLTEEQKKGVYEGLEDIKAGRVFSQEQVDKELDDLFKNENWNNEKS